MSEREFFRYGGFRGYVLVVDPVIRGVRPAVQKAIKVLLNKLSSVSSVRQLLLDRVVSGQGVSSQNRRLRLL